ncbi:MAG TPA: DSD1 family PLP-dependent enzyme [Myxococcota bacterium]|nr:DSD1 family PLP-dependent enzyme [Myxococcota bacterium]
MRVAEIDTPALVVDLERMERNIAAMARFFADKPAKLRPHWKTPKCAEVARRQLAAGAIGVTCAKLGEAEALTAAGVRTSVLIANQIVGDTKLARLLALARSVPELIVAVDSAAQVDALDRALRTASAPAPALGALIEVDTGMHRCGTDTPEETVALARRLASGRCAYRGVMGYEGHAVLVPDAAKRKELAEAAAAALTAHVAALRAAGLAPQIVSSGGTGTFDFTGCVPGVTEIQAGSYVFMDGRYREVRSDFETALTLHTTVLHRRGRLLVTDAGVKSLSNDFGPPVAFDLGARVVGLSEEHGHVLCDEGVELEPGQRLRILPSHGDTTINLHERFYAARGDSVEEIWPIVGRGRFV